MSDSEEPQLAPDPEQDFIGVVIGEYEVVKPLGKGGMGVVYLAKHRMLGRQVAVKILPPQLAQDEQLVQRFIREARAAALLNHPNIIQIFDFIQTEDMYCYVMEYVPGKTLSYFIKNFGVFEERNAINFLKVACSALGYAHNAGIVHRDIKPDNFMLTNNGLIKLGDLGLARLTFEESALTLAGSTMGTPFYISPEQIRGQKDLDARADIYSLGATTYHLVTGQVPFKGSSAADIMARHLNDSLIYPKTLNAKLSNSFCNIIAKMMTKDCNQRYQTCAEVLADVVNMEARHAAITGGVVAAPASPSTILVPADLPMPIPQLAPAPQTPDNQPRPQPEAYPEPPREDPAEEFFRSPPLAPPPPPPDASGVPKIAWVIVGILGALIIILLAIIIVKSGRRRAEYQSSPAALVCVDDSSALPRF